jgi:hypothetical protein
MTRPANTTVALSFTSLSAASLVVGIAAGTNLAGLGSAFAVAVVAATLALFAWRGGRGVADPMPTTARWWKFLGAGAGVLVAMIVTLTVTGAVDDRWWLPAILTLAAAMVSIAAGVILGVVHFTTGRASHAPG